MFRTFAILAVALSASLVAVGDPPAPLVTEGLPVGRWRIEFANGVIETATVAQDGTANVTEPLRTSPGKATMKEGSAVIAFDDDRVERWTKVGKKWVVEHWFPAAAYPESRPVLGIAKVVK